MKLAEPIFDRTGEEREASSATMDKASEAFQGFPREAFTFLADLARNNNKAWFDGHRGVYEAAVVKPALAFVDSMGSSLKTIAPSVMPEPRVGGSLFRVQRDTRFSPDKRPYKTHVGIRFRDGDTATSSRCTGPLFYVEFDAASARLGVGVKEFDRDSLEAYRTWVAGKDGARTIREAIRYARTRGHEILGDSLARVPPSYAKYPDPELLKLKGLFVRAEIGLPGAIHRAEFVDYCLGWYTPYVSFFHELRAIALRALGRPSL